MLRFICFIFCLSGILCAKAQNSPNFISEEVDETKRNSQNLCQPGVLNKSRSKGLEISYKYIHKDEFEQKSYNNLIERESKIKSVQLLTFKLKMPILLKPGLKIIAGYGYSPETYRFKSMDSEFTPALGKIDNQLLKNNSFSLTVTKPWNDKLYTAFRVKTSYKGDYDGWMNFESRYSNQNLIAIVGYKRNDLTEIAGGIAYSRDIYKSRIIPFLVINKTFNQTWGLEAVLPGKIMGRYNLNSKSLILFGAEYNSGSYSLNALSDNSPEHSFNSAPEQVSFYMKHAEINAQISLERQIVPWIWSNIKLGYQKSFNTKFKDPLSGANVYELSRSNPVYFQVGIFLSPPGDCM